MSAPLTGGRFFDQETDDLAEDFPYLEPLHGIPGLPPVSSQYIQTARFLEAMESGTAFDASDVGTSEAVNP